MKEKTFRYNPTHIKYKMKNKNYLSFRYDHNEFHQKANIIAGMKAMPNGQKHQRCQMADISIAQKFQPLKHIFGQPMICVCVKRFNVTMELFGIFKTCQTNICATRPIFIARFVNTGKR